MRYDISADREGYSMLYCMRCNYLLKGDEKLCFHCGSKKVREPQDNDPVFLISQGILGVGTIEGILDNNGIPYLKKGAMGAGITVLAGNFHEVYSIYVPFSAYEKARDALMGLFMEDEANNGE